MRRRVTTCCCCCCLARGCAQARQRDPYRALATGQRAAAVEPQEIGARERAGGGNVKQTNRQTDKHTNKQRVSRQCKLALFVLAFLVCFARELIMLISAEVVLTDPSSSRAGSTRPPLSHSDLITCPALGILIVRLHVILALLARSPALLF